MIERHDTVVVRTSVRLLVPAMVMFGIYVLLHGHYSPGGGFQGGVILAAAYILIGLGLGRAEMERWAGERLLAALCGVGVLIFAGTGAAALLYEGRFLDYGALEFLGHDLAQRRAWGILLVEMGVAITVSSVGALLFLRMTERRS